MSYCRRAAARLGRFIALSWALALLAIALPANPHAAAPVTVLRLQGAVDPASADYLVRGIRKAADTGAPMVIIELDTPGGLDTAMRQVIRAILAAPVPVAVYVTPSGARAASAGTYILYAAHVAAMAPATTLGAATPVAVGLPGFDRKPPSGKDSEADKPSNAPASAPRPSPGGGDAMTAKQVHDAAAFIRGLAQLRGRNAEWAERAVRESVSLTAAEALQAKVTDVVARDVPELLAQADGRSVRIQERDVRLATRGLAYEMRLPDWRQQLLSVIANPSVALILMTAGLWGLFFEFAAPGHGVSGVTGIICLLLAAFALQLLPVNFAALGLILVGLALLGVEAVAPAFGVLGVGGIIALVAGAILLFDPEETGVAVPWGLAVTLALASAAVVLFSARMALKAYRRPVVSGREGLLGAPGEVLQVSGDEVWAEVLGERWKVASSAALAPGQHVRVVSVRGLTLEVQADAGAASQGGTP